MSKKIISILLSLIMLIEYGLMPQVIFASSWEKKIEIIPGIIDFPATKTNKKDLFRFKNIISPKLKIKSIQNIINKSKSSKSILNNGKPETKILSTWSNLPVNWQKLWEIVQEVDNYELNKLINKETRSLLLEIKNNDLDNKKKIELIDKAKKFKLSLKFKQHKDLLNKYNKSKKSIKIRFLNIIKSEEEIFKESIKNRNLFLIKLNAEIKKEFYSKLNIYFSKEDLTLINIEPDLIYSITWEEFNDPKYETQWGLKRILGFNKLDYQVSKKVIVAVIDTWIDFTHEDLLWQMWTSPTCTIDWEVVKWWCPNWWYDFSSNDNNPKPSDWISHWTSVAWVIWAISNNEKWIASVWDKAIQLMSLKINNWEYLYLSALIDSIYFAVNNGANVINMSLWGNEYSSNLEKALLYAKNHNVIVVASAWNSWHDNDIFPLYPANIDLDNIISVWSINPEWELSSFSNFWKTVDIVAPGSSILSTKIWNNYSHDSWTSFSSPFVASIAAYFLYNNSWSYLDIINNIYKQSHENQKVIDKISWWRELRLSSDIIADNDKNKKVFLRSSKWNLIYEWEVVRTWSFVLNWDFEITSWKITINKDWKYLSDYSISSWAKTQSIDINEIWDYNLNLDLITKQWILTSNYNFKTWKFDSPASKERTYKHYWDTNPNSLIWINEFSNTWNEYLDNKYSKINQAYKEAKSKYPSSYTWDLVFEYNLYPKLNTQSLKDKKALKLQQMKTASSLHWNDLLNFYSEWNAVWEELIENRSNNINLFQINDWRKLAIINFNSHFYPDEKWELRKIKNAINKVSDLITIEDNNISYPEKMHKDLLPTNIPLNIKYYDYFNATGPVKSLWNTSNPDKSHTFTMAISWSWLHWIPRWYQIKNSSNEVIITEEFSKSKPITSNNSLSFTNIAEDLDEQFIVSNDWVKHDYILKKKLETNAEDWTYIINNFLQLPSDTQIKANDQLQQWDFQTTWSIILLNNEQNIYEIPPFLIYDNTWASLTDENQNSTVLVKWKKSQSWYLVSTIIPISWLNDPGRVFPIIIDPSSYLLQKTKAPIPCMYYTYWSFTRILFNENGKNLAFIWKETNWVKYTSVFAYDFSTISDLKWASVYSANLRARVKWDAFTTAKIEARELDVSNSISCNNMRRFSRFGK